MVQSIRCRHIDRCNKFSIFRSHRNLNVKGGVTEIGKEHGSKINRQVQLEIVAVSIDAIKKPGKLKYHDRLAPRR